MGSEPYADKFPRSILDVHQTKCYRWSLGTPEGIYPRTLYFPTEANLNYGIRSFNSALRVGYYGSEPLRLDIPFRGMRLTGTSPSWHSVFLTDPLVKTVRLLLGWRIKDGVWGSIKRSVRNQNGVTLGRLHHAALFTLDGEEQGGYYRESEECGKHASIVLADVLQQIEKKYDQEAVVGDARFHLEGVVVPTSAEWSAMV